MTTNIQKAVAKYLSGSTEQHLEEIVNHGIHNITNQFSDDEETYDAYTEEFATQAQAMLDQMQK